MRIWLNNLPRFRVFVVVSALTAIFAGLRLFQISEAPITMDESFTALYASRPWGDLWNYVTSNDIHPPFYFAFTRLFDFLGNDTFALRFPAVLVSTVSLPVLYVTAVQFGPAGQDRQDRLGGLIALTLAGISTNLIDHAQNARAYSMIFLGFALIMAGATYLTRFAGVATTPFWRPAGRPGIPALLAIVLGFLAMLWSHNIGVIYSAAAALTLIALWLMILRANGGALVNLAVAAVLVIGGWFPHLITLVQQWGAVSGDYWITAPSLIGLVMIFVTTLGDAEMIKELRPDVVVYAVLIFALAGWSFQRMVAGRNLRQIVLAAGFVGGPAAILIAITYLSQPILLDRTAMPIIGPWIVVVSAGIAALPSAIWRIGIWVTCAVSGIISTVIFFQAGPETKVPWPQMVRAIVENSVGRPMVISVPNAIAISLDYQFAQVGVDYDSVPIPSPFPTKTADAHYPTGWPGVPAVVADDMINMDAAIAKANGDVWVLLRGYWPYDPDAVLRKHLDQSYCYQPLYIPGKDFIFLLKLIPLSQAETTRCTTYAPDPYFPYAKPDAGLIPLVFSDPEPSARQP